MQQDVWTKEQLRALKHNDHAKSFEKYLHQTTCHVRDKQSFLLSWIQPVADDVILECGSSSGKTCIDLARASGCRTCGVDFDPDAVEISSSLRERHFPELTERCRFVEGDLATMRFDPSTTKVVMADFTEHVPDSTLRDILRNIADQLPRVRLYIYTPVRTHVFEVLKHRNWLLENPEGHINVKTERAMEDLLRSCGWRILSASWRPSHVPVFRLAELALGRIPGLGQAFHRRMVLLAAPEPAS